MLILQNGKPLLGKIRVRGAKNLVPKVMVASILGSEPSILRNVPEIKDVNVVMSLLSLHGVDVKHNIKNGILTMNPNNVEIAAMKDIEVHAGDSRIPILMCGPLIHKLGEAFIPDLGGCKIGDRPIDYHLNVLRNFGAVVKKGKLGIHISAPRGLHGAKIHLPYPSVGATEQVLLSATLASGITRLSGAAMEPEIMDLILVLQKMGAIISVSTDRVIHIEGVVKLKGYDHTAISDRNEAASWASAVLATGGDIEVQGANQLDLMGFLNVYRKIGGDFKVTNDGIRFFRNAEKLKSVVLETDTHPGFMTDWQQPLTVVLTQADGASIVHETVYENRFGFTHTLCKMGANIQLYRECLGSIPCRFGQRNFLHSGVIRGRTELKGKNVVIPDLRGGFSYIIAALTAKGESKINGLNIIKRGYELFPEKLEALGVNFEIMKRSDKGVA